MSLPLTRMCDTSTSCRLQNTLRHNATRVSQMLPLRLPLSLKANASHLHSFSEIPDYHPNQPLPRLHKDDIAALRHTPASSEEVELYSGKLRKASTCFRSSRLKMSLFLALCQDLLGTNNVFPHRYTLVGFPID